MKSSLPALIFIVFGVCLALFRAQISQTAVEWNYKLLGIRFNQAGYKIAFLSAGVFFTVVGVLTLLRVIQFR